MPQEEVHMLRRLLTGQNVKKDEIKGSKFDFIIVVLTETNESHKTKEDHFKPLESNFLTYLFRFLKSVSISLPEESISIVIICILNMSEEQLGKIAKDQENFQLESQRTIPPLVYDRPIELIPLPIPFVPNPCQNPVST